jgi:hypothetical protein
MEDIFGGSTQRETDKRLTISWPKGNWQKTDNIMAKGKLTKDRKYHGQRETFGHDIVSLLSVSLWPWYCLSFVSFPLTMILSVFCQFPFGHDIVCLLLVSLWPWYCLSFVSFSLWQKTDNIMAKMKLTKTDNIMARGKLTKDRKYHGQR